MDNNIIADQTRNAVWQDFLDVARLVRYYAALSGKYKRRHAMLQFVLLASAFSGIAALLEMLPEKFQLIPGALIAISIAWDFVANYARKAAILHAINYECNALEIEWAALWTDIQSARVAMPRPWTETGNWQRNFSA